MTLPIDTLVELAKSGASFRVDSKQLNFIDLCKLSVSVRESGGTLTIIDSDMLQPHLAKVYSALGGKQICFEVI